MTSGLLQQDVMRSILEAKPTERYAHISAVLGLRELERFEAGIQGCSKDATNRRKRAESNVTEARERFEDVAARLETVEQRAVRQAPVDLAHSAIEALLRDQPDGLEIDFPESLDKDNAFVLAQNSRQLREQVAEAHPLAEELQSERAGLEVEPTSQQLESLERAVQESTADRMSVDRAFQRASQDLSAAEEMSQQVARLAATAIPLLSEDCPVCRQSINPNEIETYLRGLADDTSSLLELRQTEVAAQAELAAAREREQQAIALLESANAVVSGWARLRERESALATRWTELHVERHGAFAVGGSIAGLNQLAPEIVRFLDDLADSLERYIDAVGVTLSAGHIDRVRSELRSAQLSLDSLSSRYEQTSLRAARFKRLADASTQARVEVTTKRFAAVEPLCW